jgi:Ni/Fe-hydrogenase subunit HybB-like protein
MDERRYSQISLGLITAVTLGPAMAFLIANYCVSAPWLPIVLGALMAILSLLPVLLLAVSRFNTGGKWHPLSHSDRFSTKVMLFSILFALPLGLAAAVLLLRNGPTHAALTVATTFVTYIAAMYVTLNVDRMHTPIAIKINEKSSNSININLDNAFRS